MTSALHHLPRQEHGLIQPEALPKLVGPMPCPGLPLALELYCGLGPVLPGQKAFCWKIVAAAGGHFWGWVVVVVESRPSELREGRMKEVVGVVTIADSFEYKVVVRVLELVGVMVFDL
ncbi:hypothetical protein Pyn_21492 [Prunus yedoensis var. nudiflora]|uniref:Uncharacterized protein n=1 Tax=Prunus yedoensis var. nudiflora TaxID=2094558 RepID=A0A314U860_PRUYE|nr:hypothetical protein Pyn_21492 [Prunus yedoensis var. nudiflora]